MRNAPTPPAARSTEADLAYARQMYGDLLVKILANTIYEDPAMDATFSGKFVPATRAWGGDWPSIAHTMVGVGRLNDLKTLLQRCLDDGISGDVIETGVWRGGCCILMKGILEINQDGSRRVFVADSFEGLPPPDPERYPADRGDVHHTFAELAVSEDEVRANFMRYGLLDDRVVFVKGFFEDTLPDLSAEQFALLRLDGDMYGSTMVALRNLYPRLSSGGYVVIDDYGCVPGCKRAVDDYCNEHGIKVPFVSTAGAGIWWQKP